MATSHIDAALRVSQACYPISMSQPEGSLMCGPAFYTTEPIDPELFDDRGPTGQVLAGSMPVHDVYIQHRQAEDGSDDEADGDGRRPQPVHLLAWDLLAGVLFFASGKPPIACR